MDPALPIGRVKLSYSSGGIVEKKVGKIAITTATRNNLRQTGTPPGLLSKQRDTALPVGRIKLSYSSSGIVEEKVGEVDNRATTKLTRNDLPPGRQAGVLSKRIDPALSIGCEKIQCSSSGIVEKKVSKIASSTKPTRNDLPPGRQIGVLSKQMDPASFVGGVKLPCSSSGIVEEKVGKRVVITEPPLNDLRPSGTPAVVLCKQ